MRLAVIPGDGIGIEVTDAGAAGARGGRARRRDDALRPRARRAGTAPARLLPDSVLDELREHDAILLGAVGDPSVPSGVLERGLLLRLRFELDHHVNLRPARLYPGVRGAAGRRARRSTSSSCARAPRARTPATAACCARARRTRSPPRCQRQHRLRRRAGRARRVRPRRSAVRASTSRWCTRTTCSPIAGDLWSRHRRGGRRWSSPTSTVAYQHVDAATIYLVTDPGRFDVIVTDNLFGDIITDLAAAIAGGIGLAASGNLDVSRTQPEHVRAGARLGARHRRPGHGRPDRRRAVGRDAARPPRRARRGRGAGRGRGRRSTSPPATTSATGHTRRSATGSPPWSAATRRARTALNDGLRGPDQDVHARAREVGQVGHRWPRPRGCRARPGLRTRSPSRGRRPR